MLSWSPVIISWKVPKVNYKHCEINREINRKEIGGEEQILWGEEEVTDGEKEEDGGTE